MEKPIKSTHNNSSNALSLVVSDKQISITSRLLSKRDIYSLLLDRSRIRQAIELAINARYFLDPWFDPVEFHKIDKSELEEKIFIAISTLSGLYSKPVRSVLSTLRAFWTFFEYENIQPYAIRYLLAMVLSERIVIPDNVYTGRDEVFKLIQHDIQEELIDLLNKRQREIIENKAYNWAVCVRIDWGYNSISKEILCAIVQRKLQLADDNPFIKILSQLVERLTIGSWCDRYLQNVYLNELDMALAGGNWHYSRFSENLWVYTYTQGEAELALQIIKDALARLELVIDRYDRVLCIEPVITLSDYNNKNRETYIAAARRLDERVVSENILKIAEPDWYVYHNNYIKYASFSEARYFNWQSSSLKQFRMDYAALLKEFKESENPGKDLFNIVFKYITSDEGLYHQSYQLIKLYILKAVNQPADLAYDYLCQLIDKYKNPYGSSRNYKTYAFLRAWFWDFNEHPQVSAFRDGTYFEKMWDKINELLFSLIKSRTDNCYYLSKTIQYIFKEELFVASPEGIYTSQDFWLSTIEQHMNESAEFPYTNEAGNILAFLDGWMDYHIPILLHMAACLEQKREYEDAAWKYLLASLLTEEEPDQFAFQIGVNFFKGEDYFNAVDFLSYRLRKNKDSEAYHYRALAKNQMKDYAGALDDLNEAILIVYNKQYYIDRAAVYASLNRLKEAIADISTVIHSGDFYYDWRYEDRQVLFSLANYLRRDGDLDGAIECAKKYYENKDEQKVAVELLQAGNDLPEEIWRYLPDKKL
jgi:hypothetical protein